MKEIRDIYQALFGKNTRLDDKAVLAQVIRDVESIKSHAAQKRLLQMSTIAELLDRLLTALLLDQLEEEPKVRTLLVDLLQRGNLLAKEATTAGNRRGNTQVGDLVSRASAFLGLSSPSTASRR